MYWQIQAILEELFNLAKDHYRQRPRLTLAAGFVAALLLVRGTGCIATALFSTQPAVTFAYKKLSGEIRYEDDSPIPVTGMLVCFVDRQSGQSLGCATVDAKDGRFSTTVRRTMVGQGGSTAAVTIASAAGDALASDVVPEEYATATLTPLTVNLTNTHVEIRVKKP